MLKYWSLRVVVVVVVVIAAPAALEEEEQGVLSTMLHMQ